MDAVKKVKAGSMTNQLALGLPRGLGPTSPAHQKMETEPEIRPQQQGLSVRLCSPDLVPAENILGKASVPKCLITM